MAKNSAVVRALPYPALEEGNGSYPDGLYEVSIEPGSDGFSVKLSHSVTGANFIQRLLESKKAKYGCSVVVPITGYRRLHLSDTPDQEISWDLGAVGEPPMLRPLIVATEAKEGHTFDSKDGLFKAWQGVAINIPKGARLAIKPYYRPVASLHQMLEIEHQPDMKAGSLEVRESTEEGFYFKVRVASDIYEFLNGSGHYSRHGQSVYTHMVSRCFEILVKDYKNFDDADMSPLAFRNLKALADELVSKGLPWWQDEDFVPDKVATQLYPHRPPVLEDDESTE